MPKMNVSTVKTMNYELKNKAKFVVSLPALSMVEVSKGFAILDFWVMIYERNIDFACRMG